MPEVNKNKIFFSILGAGGGYIHMCDPTGGSDGGALLRLSFKSHSVSFQEGGMESAAEDEPLMREKKQKQKNRN